MSSDDDPDDEVGEGLLDREMGPSSALAHLYRGELHRMKLWRERLDRTTNWAVVSMAALLTWAFSQQSNPHYILLIGLLTIGAFLNIEARRYRAYDMWRSRARTLQRNVFAKGLDTNQPVQKQWRKELGAAYDRPTFRISREEAIAHRLRRVYLPLFIVLGLAWVARITAFATDSWPTTAAVGPLSGLLITGVVGVLYVVLFGVAFRPREWETRGELLEQDNGCDTIIEEE